MPKKLKITVTTTLVYEPDPENYTSAIEDLVGVRPATIEEMAAVDLENLNDDCAWVIEDENSNTTVNVEVVEE